MNSCINNSTIQQFNSTFFQGKKVLITGQHRLQGELADPLAAAPGRPRYRNRPAARHHPQPLHPPGPQQFNSSTNQQINSSTIQQINSSTNQQINSSTNQQFNKSTIHQPLLRHPRRSGPCGHCNRSGAGDRLPPGCPAPGARLLP